MRADHHAGRAEMTASTSDTPAGTTARRYRTSAGFATSASACTPSVISTTAKADDERQHADPDRVHMTIVGGRTEPCWPADHQIPRSPQLFGTCSQFVYHPHDSV